MMTQCSCGGSCLNRFVRESLTTTTTTTKERLKSPHISHSYRENNIKWTTENNVFEYNKTELIYKERLTCA